MENATTAAPVECLVGPFAAENIDRELWRERPGDYYADSLHVNDGGGIGINVGGLVIVRPLREWHRAMRLMTPMTPMTAEEADAAYEDAPSITMTDEEIQAIVAKVTAKGRTRTYRKRPVVVEAEQFFVGKPLPFSDRGPVVCFDGEWYVETIHGQRTVLADGDWVILEPRGVHQAYPCKPDIFEQTYDVVS